MSQRDNNMPALSINKPKKKSPLPPCGRRRKVTVPHSPFQKLVEAARVTRQMSTREIAKEMNSRGAKVDQSTVWVWLHSENGYPAPRSFTAKHLKALAAALKLREPEIRKALDESRAIYTGQPEPTPRPQLDALATLQTTLEQTDRVTVKRQWVLHLVKSLRASAEAAQKPVK